MRRLRRAFVLFSITGLLVALTAGPAAAQQYPPGQDGLAVSLTVVTPGGTITVTAPPQSFEPGSVVEVNVGPAGGQSSGAGVPLATVGSSILAQGQSGEPFTLHETITAAGDGSAEITFEIPEDTQPGRYVVTMSGTAPDGSAQTLSSAFTVAAEQAEAGQAQGLAATGANTTLWAGVALGLLVIGGGAAYAARRRRRSETGAETG